MKLSIFNCFADFRAISTLIIQRNQRNVVIKRMHSFSNGYSLNWTFEYKKEVQLNPGIKAIRREITSKDTFPHGKYKKRKLPKEQYYAIQLMEKNDEYINEVYCTKLEADESLQSLDVVV